MDQSLIWSHFQSERADAFDQALPRYRFLASQLPRGKILNIGVGVGGFEQAAASTGRDIFSLDPDAKAVERLNERGLSTALTGSVVAIPFSDSFFDAVVCSEVLEHLTDDVLQLGLSEIRRVLIPGARLIGTVPADENLKDLETVCPCCGTVFHRFGHVQSFSPDRLASVLRAVGTPAVERRMFVAWRALNYKGKIGAAFRVGLSALGSYGAGHNLYFAVRKN